MRMYLFHFCIILFLLSISCSREFCEMKPCTNVRTLNYTFGFVTLLLSKVHAECRTVTQMYLNQIYCNIFAWLWNPLHNIVHFLLRICGKSLRNSFEMTAQLVTEFISVGRAMHVYKDRIKCEKDVEKTYMEIKKFYQCLFTWFLLCKT